MSRCDLSYVEVQELQDEAVQPPVVDVSQAGDEVVLGVGEPVQDEPLSLHSALVVRARLVELERHWGAVKHGDPAVHHTTPTLPDLGHVSHCLHPALMNWSPNSVDRGNRKNSSISVSDTLNK